MVPECQCSSTRPVESQNGYSLSGDSGRRLVGQGEDARLAVGEAVELHTLAALDIGIAALADSAISFPGR